MKNGFETGKLEIESPMEKRTVYTEWNAKIESAKDAKRTKQREYLPTRKGATKQVSPGGRKIDITQF